MVVDWYIPEEGKGQRAFGVEAIIHTKYGCSILTLLQNLTMSNKSTHISEVLSSRGVAMATWDPQV